MVKATKKPPASKVVSVTRRDSSSSGNADGIVSSLFHPSNRPSLLVGIIIGMSVMGISVRMRESTDLSHLNDLMTTTTSSAAGTIVDTSDSSTISSDSVAQASVGLRSPMTTRRKHPKFDPSWDIFQRIEAEQTGRVRAPRNNAMETDRPVRFVNHKQLEENDSFSASWLQKRESFLSMKLDEMGICEDAAFYAYSREHQRLHSMRMPADWLDFSVEHLSKWYNMMNIMENDIPLYSAIEKLEAYMTRGQSYPVGKEPFLKETIAVISFQAIQYADKSDKSKKVTIPTLAATVESLRRAGFGRVVVVGVEASDEELAKDAFQLIHRLIRDQSEPHPAGVQRVGHMEVGFARGHMGHAKTAYHSLNIPRATLMGLREAFRIQERGDNDHDSIVNMRTWLGDHQLNYWKYVYLTEPDSVLATRPSTLKTIKRYVEGGTVLIPWRLQPIPHESDVRGCRQTHRYVKDAGEFQDILELDALDANPDKCCDEFAGPNFRPGMPPNFPDCGNFWYMCGFMPEAENNPHANDRLKPYKLIRLKHGTRLVHLASQEHGRRCIPMKSENKDICEPPEGK